MKSVPFENGIKEPDDEDDRCFILDGTFDNCIEMISFSYVGDVSKDHAILNYRKLDSKNCTIEKKLLFKNSSEISESLTIEKVKQIIEESKTAAHEAGLSRSQYIVDEFNKIKSPVISNDNFTTVTYELKSNTEGVREYISYPDVGNKDKVVLSYNKYVPGEGWIISGDILFDYQKEELD